MKWYYRGGRNEEGDDEARGEFERREEAEGLLSRPCLRKE